MRKLKSNMKQRKEEMAGEQEADQSKFFRNFLTSISFWKYTFGPIQNFGQTIKVIRQYSQCPNDCTLLSIIVKLTQ